MQTFRKRTDTTCTPNAVSLRKHCGDKQDGTVCLRLPPHDRRLELHSLLVWGQSHCSELSLKPVRHSLTHWQDLLHICYRNAINLHPSPLNTLLITHGLLVSMLIDEVHTLPTLSEDQKTVQSWNYVSFWEYLQGAKSSEKHWTDKFVLPALWSQSEYHFTLLYVPHQVNICHLQPLIETSKKPSVCSLTFETSPLADFSDPDIYTLYTSWVSLCKTLSSVSFMSSADLKSKNRLCLFVLQHLRSWFTNIQNYLKTLRAPQIISDCIFPCLHIADAFSKNSSLSVSSCEFSV